MTKIIGAYYGIWDSVKIVTPIVEGQYSAGVREFHADYHTYGDPCPGYTKYLVIAWEQDGESRAGIVGDNDGKIIRIP
jgi:hypothetical protein